MKQPLSRMVSMRLASLLLILGPLWAHAQQFSISTPAINTCSGVLEDTGGPTGTYGNNENFTTVICPDVPGDAISLNWFVFNLSQQLPQPIDRVKIWDGNSTNAPFLGEYTGTQLQGLISSATIYNLSGCLTVQFTSNQGGVGDFAAGITCYTPCERPTAVATMSEPTSPAKVCVGEPIVFDGTGSYAAPNFNLVEYNWDFHDGATANTPTVTHAFSTPGQYMVQLNLVDDNGCVNSNMVDLEVLVSTTPSFVGTMESTELCLGAVVDLTAVATPTLWTGMPEANFGDGVMLPDDLGIPFTSDLLFTQFEPGQTVNNTDAIISICTNMEHSFMGDLVVQINCPNGQTMIMHQQGGGGTYIGGANDSDWGSDPVPGECWQYCWSPNATLGTWANCAAFGPTPNVMTGGTPPGNSLVPGTYSSVQPFSNLIGCPLNGTWTFTVTDLWGADNGFLCDWSINFDPSLIPDTAQFTPVLGTTSLDSAGWTGPFLTQDPANPLVAQSTPTAPGTYDYTFHVTDDFGCTYDTTVTVTIAPQMVVDAGPNITLCNDSLPMAGAITANGPPQGCTWTLVLYDTWGDGWSGGAQVTVSINGVNTPYTLSGFSSQQTINLTVTTGATLTLSYTTGSWNTENSFTLFNDLGTAVYASPGNPSGGQHWSGTVLCGGVPPVTYAWTPATGLANPSDPESMVWVAQPTWYHLAVYPTGSPECAVTDSVLVSPPDELNPGEDNDVVVCQSDPVFLMTDSLGGTVDLGGVWTTGNTTVGNTFSPVDHAPGTYSYTYTVTTAGGCVGSAELGVTVLPDTDPTCCGNPDAGPDNYSCNLSIALHATPGNTGVGEWTGPTGAVFADASSAQTTVTVPQGGSYWFYWRENDGVFCNKVDSVRMTFTDAIVITMDTTDAVCFSYCDGTASATVTGGNAANGFTYQWSAGNPGNTPASVTGLCMGSYQLTVLDDNDCSATTSFVIGQPVLLEIDSITRMPVTCSGDCDGVITIHDGQAVEYSFDGGATWGTEAQADGACEGLHQLVIRDAKGCVGTGHTVVTGPPPVEAEFVWGPIPATVENPTIYFHNTSTGAQTYYWDIAGQAYSTAADTWHTFSNKAPDSYEVCMVAYNYNLCSDTVCHEVLIEDVLEPYVPNAFTPNADGHNDLFYMSVNVPIITDFEMLIYDRWGQLVFETKDPYQGWNGAKGNSGEILPSGVYVYRIRFEVSRLETKRELFGHVTLLK